MIKLLLIAKQKINREWSENDSQILLTYGRGLLINYCYCWHFVLFYFIFIKALNKFGKI